MIRVVIPYHLRVLANIESEVQLDVQEPVTTRTVLDALEDRYPALRGTIRDQASGNRRPMVRYYACEQDISLDSSDEPLPEAIATGAESFLIVAAIAGG